MPRVKMSDAQRAATLELLEDLQDLRAQLAEGVEAELVDQDALDIVDGRIRQMEAALRIF